MLRIFSLLQALIRLEFSSAALLWFLLFAVFVLLFSAFWRCFAYCTEDIEVLA